VRVPDTAPAPRSAPPGVRLGVDVGAVRIGVAQSDPEGVLATPVRTLTVQPGGTPGTDDPGSADGLPEATVAALAALVGQHAAYLVYVGWPLSMDGTVGPAARRAQAVATALAGRIAPARVRLVDERLTTVAAHRRLHDSGRRGRAHREVVDQVAAVLILQGALDAERATGAEPGQQVGPATRGRRRTRREDRG
jgi:putative Holliday junction resolvase